MWTISGRIMLLEAIFIQKPNWNQIIPSLGLRKKLGAEENDSWSRSSCLFVEIELAKGILHVKQRRTEAHAVENSYHCLFPQAGNEKPIVGDDAIVSEEIACATAGVVDSVSEDKNILTTTNLENCRSQSAELEEHVGSCLNSVGSDFTYPGRIVGGAWAGE